MSRSLLDRNYANFKRLGWSGGVHNRDDLTRPVGDYASVVLADSPALLYRFNDAPTKARLQGNFRVFDAAKGNHGTYIDFRDFVAPGALIWETVGQGVSMSAGTDVISIPNDASLNFADVFTIETWFKRVTLGSYQFIYAGGAAAPAVAINASNVVELLKQGTGVSAISLAVPALVDTMEWHHLVVTKNATANNIWIDGVNVTSTVTNQTMASNALTKYVGWDNSTATQNWKGYLDEVALYPTVLTEQHIQEHYQKATSWYWNTIMADLPVAYFGLGETGATAYDSTQTGMTGTYTAPGVKGFSGAIWGDRGQSYKNKAGYVTAATNRVLDFDAKDFSLECWYRLETAGSQFVWLMSKGSQFGLIIENANPAKLLLDNFVTEAARSTVNVNTDQRWHHVVCTRTGSTYKLYFDGVDVTGTTAAQTFTSNAGAFTIGVENDLFGPITAALDEAAVYPYVLTSEQVREHFQVGNSAYRREVMRDAPNAYWRLGERSGLYAIDELGWNSGTYANGPTLGGVGPLTDTTATSVLFNGTNQYVSVSDSPTLDIGDLYTNDNPQSWECWFRRTGGFATSYRYLMSKGNGGAIWFDNTDKLGFDQDGSISATSTTAFTTDTGWHHVVCVHDAGAAKQNKIYIDGVEEAVTGTNNAFSRTADPLLIGAYIGLSNFYFGSIAEVAIYPYALTAERIRAHYVTGASTYRATIMAESGLVGYWKHGEGAGSLIMDAYRYGQDGVYKLAPTLGQTGAMSAEKATSVRYTSASSQYAEVLPHPESFDRGSGNGPYSYEWWMKYGDLTVAQQIWQTGVGSFAARTNSVANGVVEVVAEGTNSIKSSTPITDTTLWHHFVATKDATQTWALYQDGVDVTTLVTGSVTISDTTAALQIGRKEDGTTFLNANLQEFAVYDLALTLSQAQAHYVAGGGTLASSGVVWPTFLGGGYY